MTENAEREWFPQVLQISILSITKPLIHEDSDLNNQKKESFRQDPHFFNNLPEEIHGEGSILVLPFEDVELVSILQTKYPHSMIEVIRKQDIAGIQVLSLLHRLRKDRNDLVVASLYDSTAKRTTSMTELMLSACRSRQRLIRDLDGKFRRITFGRIAFVVLPQLILGSVLGVMFLVLNELFSFYVSSISTPKERHLPHDKIAGTILFLRTDLAGELKAGGSVSHVKGIVKGFIELGYKVVYVADAKLQALPTRVEQVVIQPIRMLDFFDEFQLLAFNIQLIFKAGFLIRRFEPVMIYQRLSVFNFAGGIIAKRANVPMILEANASEVWAKKNWSRLFFDSLASRCESIALNLSDKISIVSEIVMEQLSKYNVPEGRFIVSPNGVNADEFNPNIDGSEVRNRYDLDQKIVIGFIGTFTKWHGVETLCDAAITAIKQDLRLRFLMIGDGDLKSALQNKVAEMKYEQYFVFTGLIPHHEAPRYLAACDILVSPHLGFTDGTKFFGSPTKLFEYMAMGKPIIASKLEQIGEIIIDGVNGLWMIPGSQEELAEKILLLASDTKLRRQLGNEARNESEKKYTWKANVENLLKQIR